MAGRSEKYQSTLVSDLDLLLRHPGIWRADRGGSVSGGALATGFSELDRALPAMIEEITERVLVALGH